MRKLLILTGILLTVALLVTPTIPAQDTVINVYQGAGPPPTTLPRSAVPVYAPPPPPVIPYRGDYIVPDPGPQPSGGCHGRTGGCYGRSHAPQAYAIVPVGGCTGRAAAGGCFGSYGGPATYGAPRGDGTYATPSGRPAPPGVLPFNGPLIGTWRAAAGYDRHYRP